jgi:hypothetical protein
LWIAEIKERFFYKGNWVVGLNEKFLREARNKDVMLRVKVGEHAEIPMQVPTEKYLKEKIKLGEFKDEPSRFENGSPMRIYYFEL